MKRKQAIEIVLELAKRGVLDFNEVDPGSDDDGERMNQLEAIKIVGGMIDCPDWYSPS